ncbi:MAG: hypothetical protein KHX03_05585 [Clostridium sp.]|nr:hypothetical protein [Clostridium sp.]
MSISPISASMMSMYVANSAAASSAEGKDYEYELIKQQLLAMGLTITGDKDTDKARLETAQRIQEMMQSQSSSSSRQSIPFDDIMNTLNLTVTGDLDKDYDTTIDKLDYEIGMAYTDEEKEYYEALKDQVESEYNSSKQNSISYFSGTSQIASLNRYMLGI